MHLVGNFCLLLMMLAGFSNRAQAQEPFIGEIKMFAGNFAPNGWLLCEGQTLNISSNEALYSILGTYYGGDGISNFKLPDLRGRFPMGAGSASNGQNYNVGQTGGNNTVTLTTAQMPAHTHSLAVSNTEGNTDNPQGATIAVGTTPDLYKVKSFSTTGPTSTLAPSTVTPSGNNQPIDITPRYIGIRYIICIAGIYPSRG